MVKGESDDGAKSLKRSPQCGSKQSYYVYTHDKVDYTVDRNTVKADSVHMQQTIKDCNAMTIRAVYG